MAELSVAVHPLAEGSGRIKSPNAEALKKLRAKNMANIVSILCNTKSAKVAYMHVTNLQAIQVHN